MLRELAGGWTLATAPEAEDAARRLLAKPRTPPLTPAQAETLAIVAYLQPVSRPEITRIRGVSADSAAATLLERGLIEEAGRSQFGAVLYRTTPLFLKLFGLASLDDLPDPAAWDPSPEEEADLRERLLRAGEARAGGAGRGAPAEARARLRRAGTHDSRSRARARRRRWSAPSATRCSSASRTWSPRPSRMRSAVEREELRGVGRRGAQLGERRLRPRPRAVVEPRRRASSRSAARPGRAGRAGGRASAEVALHWVAPARVQASISSEVARPRRHRRARAPLRRSATSATQEAGAGSARPPRRPAPTTRRGAPRAASGQRATVGAPDADAASAASLHPAARPSMPGTPGSGRRDRHESTPRTRSARASRRGRGAARAWPRRRRRQRRSRRGGLRAASCPHAASMSRPRVSRTVASKPRSSSAARNAAIASRPDPSYTEPVGLYGIRLTL